jgi:DNA-directed RNA polymerase specialized sigma24 family protein
MVAVRCINSTSFTTWLLKNNKKLDHWCRDSFYEEWLNEYLKKEAVQDALERALKTMEEYAMGDSGLASFSHYFKYGNHNRICHHITTGRVSPWIIYNCNSGIEFLESLDEVLLAIVLPWVDPDYWNRKFVDHVADAEWCKHVLKKAGL